MSLEDKSSELIAQLKQIRDDYSSVTFANSFGAEDMVLMDVIARHVPEISVFTLDTGRLPSETYELMEKSRSQYEIPIKPLFPKREDVERYITENGPNGFYNSIEARKACCKIRKVDLLKQELAQNKAWITGLRRQQSTTREDMTISEWDEGNGLQKFNPLLDWTEKEVWEYIKQNDVPYNALHDKGYPSIGCAPCTRAITVGEDVRAGRWWWEDPDSKECGLHVKS